MQSEKEGDLAREREVENRISRLEEISRNLSEEIEAKQRVLAGLKRSYPGEDHSQAGLVRSEIATEPQIWAALQTIRDGFAIFDKDHRLVLANRAYLSVFDGVTEVAPGVTYERLCDLLVSEGILAPQPEGAAWSARMKRRWRREVIPHETIHLVGGSYIKLMDRRLADGGVVVLAVNQTKIMRILAAIEALPDGFVVFDSNDMIVTANETYLNLVEITRDEVENGVSFGDLIRKGIKNGLNLDPEVVECEWLEQRVHDHLSGTGEPMEFLTAAGRWWRAVDILLPDGGRAGLRMDITELKQQQRELERLAEAAEAASRAKSAFLSNMSHEIRTPMNGLLGMSDLLLSTKLDDSQKEMVETLRSSANDLLGLLDNVLEFSRTQTGRVELKLAPVSTTKLWADIVPCFMTKARDRELTLTFDATPDVPTSIIADARRVHQVIVSLLSNALKFTANGGIAVRCWVDAGRLFIAIEDTGPGVPPDRVAHIFDGFAQGEEGFDRHHGGTGLGLAICKSIVTRMGGELSYRPRPGGGSVFIFTLPITPGADEAPPPTAQAATRQVRVLAVEDNAVNRLVLTKLLEPLDLQLRLVDSAAACLEEVRKDPPDLLLTDISMPDMDGREMTRRVRAWEAEAGRTPLRIVAMTAHALASDIEDILAAGLDHVLTKPLSRDLLAEECAAAVAG